MSVTKPSVYAVVLNPITQPYRTQIIAAAWVSNSRAQEADPRYLSDTPNFCQGKTYVFCAPNIAHGVMMGTAEDI